MKNIFGSIFGILLLASAATISAQSGDSGRLAGTWNAVVTPRDCATGAAKNAFQSSYYFAQGGTFSGLSSSTGSGGRGREQIGVWRHVSGNHYRFNIKSYNFDAAGVATGYGIVTHELDLDDDALNWSSAGDLRTYNLDGIEISSGCSTIVASRVADL